MNTVVFMIKMTPTSSLDSGAILLSTGVNAEYPTGNRAIATASNCRFRTSVTYIYSLILFMAWILVWYPSGFKNKTGLTSPRSSTIIFF